MEIFLKIIMKNMFVPKYETVWILFLWAWLVCLGGQISVQS